MWDCEYGCAPFVLKTADIEADKLVRLRSNLCLWGAPPPYSGKGRPRKHGDKFKLNDPQTWGEPDESLEVDDPQLGRVRIGLWKGLHFRAAASHPMLLLRIERLEEQHTMHVIAYSVSGSPLGERWLDGKPRRETWSQGGIAIIPKGIAHRCNWNASVQFMVLAIEPAFLFQVGQDLVNCDRIELIPHFMTEQDALIRRYDTLCSPCNDAATPAVGCLL